MENVVHIHDGLSNDLNPNIEAKMLMSNKNLKQDHDSQNIESQNKTIQSDIALYKANDKIKKLESKLFHLKKKNNQLHSSLQHYRQECEKLKHENIDGLNVIKLLPFGNCIPYFLIIFFNHIHILG